MDDLCCKPSVIAQPQYSNISPRHLITVRRLVMLPAVSKLRGEIQAGEIVAAEDTAETIDIELPLDRGKTPGAFGELIEILQRLPDPQCKLGQTLVNVFLWHWKYVPTDDAYNLLRLCKAHVGEVRHVGAHQAMIEALADEHLTIVAGDA